MKFKATSIVLFILILSGLSSCKEFIEPSVEKKSISPLAPGNQYQSTTYAISFWWDEVEDATQYRLQIVTPDFDTIGALVADTIVKTNKFLLSLEPGNYQWRVRAENGSSQTIFSEKRNFTILASSVKQQKVILNSPVSNLVTNQSSLVFNWNSLYGATRYSFQIDTANFTDESKVVFSQTSPSLQVNYSFPKDQQYQWRVRAENDTAQSLWSAVRIVNVDRTLPSQVTLSSPGAGQTITLPVSLQWNALAGAARYKVYALKGDSTTLYNQSFPALSNTNNYIFNAGASGERIYWKVTAVDAAGNEGQASKLFNFVVQ